MAPGCSAPYEAMFCELLKKHARNMDCVGAHWIFINKFGNGVGIGDRPGVERGSSQK